MLKKTIITLLLFAGLIGWVEPVLASAPLVQARSAILMNRVTGEILYEKNAWERRAPASTTKILTAILALEKGQPDTVIEVSENAAAVGEATLHLNPGDSLTIRDLLHGALMKSGNDACVALAEAVSPSEAEFVNLMNFKARVLGAENTTFYNTNGLPHNGHLTTAYDLALIARYAMQNPVFAEIVGKRYYPLTWQDSKRSLHLKNTNKLLWSYQWATGIKTGTTNKAGKCLVAAGSYQDREMIVVVLNTPDRFGDAVRLLEFGLK